MRTPAPTNLPCVRNPAVSRRTAIRGAAWSLPVVVVASAAPASAASDVMTAGISVLGTDPIKVGDVRTATIGTSSPALRATPVTLVLPAGVATWTATSTTTISGVTGWANSFFAEMRVSPDAPFKPGWYNAGPFYVTGTFDDGTGPRPAFSTEFHIWKD